MRQCDIRRLLAPFALTSTAVGFDNRRHSGFVRAPIHICSEFESRGWDTCHCFPVQLCTHTARGRGSARKGASCKTGTDQDVSKCLRNQEDGAYEPFKSLPRERAAEHHVLPSSCLSAYGKAAGKRPPVESFSPKIYVYSYCTPHGAKACLLANLYPPPPPAPYVSDLFQWANNRWLTRKRDNEKLMIAGFELLI